MVTRNVQLKKKFTKLVWEIELTQVTHLIIIGTSSIKDKSSDPKIIGIKTNLFENFSQKKGSRKF